MKIQKFATMYHAVEESAKSFPDHSAYMFMGKKTNYRSLLIKINEAARALSAIGTKAGDIICIAMPNLPQAIILIYAANKIGATVNMIHPLSSEAEILDFVNRVDARTILILDQFYDKIKNIRHQTHLEKVIVADIGEVLSPIKKIGYALTSGRKIKRPDPSEDVIFWQDFLAQGMNHDEPSICQDENKTALILHSGGTTGKVKGVCLSNLNVNEAAKQMIEANPMLVPEDRFLSVMPIFHGNGLVIGIHSMLMIGATCVLIPRFTPETYAKDLLRYRCRYMSGVPALFERLMGVEIMKNADLSFLKGVFSGADFLSEELEIKLNEFLKAHHAPVVIRQGYGMTEGVVATSLNPIDKQKPGSVGIPLPGVKLKIVEPGTDIELPVGEIGEIVFSSATNMQGYYHDPEETANTLKKHGDGLEWIHSADLGSVDEEGFVFFRGRIKRMIVVNGYNVFPNELENIIEGFEMVDRCCVAGVPSGESTQKVKAFVVLKAGYLPTDETRFKIREESKKFIARYAIPKEIDFIDEMPKTKVGKVDVNALLKGEKA